MTKKGLFYSILIDVILILLLFCENTEFVMDGPLSFLYNMHFCDSVSFLSTLCLKIWKHHTHVYINLNNSIDISDSFMKYSLNWGTQQSPKTLYVPLYLYV